MAEDELFKDTWDSIKQGVNKVHSSFENYGSFAPGSNNTNKEKGFMFSNVGEKIRRLATVICWAGIISSLLGAIAFWAIGDILVLVGFIVLIMGSLLSWVGSFILYGYGELIEKTTEIARNTRSLPYSSPEPTNPSVHNRLCISCNTMTDTNPCEHCGILTTSIEPVDSTILNDSCDICSTDGKVVYVEIKDSKGTRIRKVCRQCYDKIQLN